jgi:hypothetical protein
MKRTRTARTLALSLFAGAFAAAATAGTAPIVGGASFVPDPSFATEGLAILQFDDTDALWNEPVRTLAAADGSYWTLGFARTGNGGLDQFAIMHLLADGTPDAGFGTNGQRLVTSAAVQLVDATMDAAGNFYVASIVSGDGADFMIECFAADLTPCAGFGIAGQTRVAFDQGGPNDDITHHILIHQNSIYVLGDVDTPATDGSWDVAIGVAKLDLASGQLDPNFGNVKGLGGRSVFNIDLVANGGDFSADFAFSADGTRLIVGGNAQASDPFSGIALQDAIVLGVDPASGQLDPSFADAGMQDVPFAVGESIGQFFSVALAVRHNGRIVFAGSYWQDHDGMVNPQVSLIELMPDGSLAQDFGDNGVANSLPGYNIEVVGVAERPGLGDLVVTMQTDGLLPGDFSGVHQQAVLDYSPNGRTLRSEFARIIPSNAIDTGAASRPVGILVDAQNRSLMWGWRNWQFVTHPPYIFDRDITVSRFIDSDAIFGNGFSGSYAD